MKLNLELNCRVCLEQSDNMLSIFTQDGCQTIATKIADCAGIKIELNENKNIYPRNICPKCIAYLNIAYKFRSTCRNSEKLLHSLVLDLDEDISESAKLLYKTENENLEPQNLFDESEIIIQIETNINESEKKIENFDSENDDDDDDDDEYLEIQALESDSNGSNGNEIISHEMCTTTKQYNNIKKVKSKILEIEEKQSLENVNFEICESYEDISQYYIEEEKLDETDASVENQHNINFIRNYNQINTRKLINESEIESCIDIIDEDYHQNKKKRDLSQKQKRKTYKKSIGKNKSKKNKIFQKEQNKSVIVKDEMKPNEYVCEVCGNKYNKKALFDTHLRWHSEEKAYKCEVCGRAFTINFQLTRHMRVHTGDKPYACSVCGRKFSDYTTCKKHKRTHTDERPFKCEICKKGFNYAHVLRVHMATHTGEKPYVCYQCDKKFSQPHHLKAHLATLLHRSGIGTSTAAANTTTTTMIAKHEFIEIESKMKIKD